MDFVKSIENFVFGMDCLGCGRSSEILDPWLCPDCARELKSEAMGACFPAEDVFCLYPMRSVTRRLIHSLKYKSLPGMASYLVRKSSAVHGEISDAMDALPKPFFFVPVPLHRARYRERGYNQAERIAAALAALYGGRVCHWLKRKSFRVSQTKLSKEEREWNVAGAFEAVLPKKIPERGTLFIVDDVYTTGATTSACLNAFGDKFPIPTKVCTLLYDQPSTASADYAADIQAFYGA